MRDRGNDCIAVTAESSHAGGSPINQRECAGFNWPELSIPAEEPVSISPEAVSRAGPVKSAVVRRSISPSPCGPAPFVSLVRGVGHPLSSATVLRLLSLFPASLLPFCAGVPAIGVGQPAIAASAGSAPPAWFGPPFDPSVARGVFQPACHTTLPRRPFSGTFTSGLPPSLWSRVVGVGQPFRCPVEPLADVGRAEARSAEIDSPAGVTRSFQVSLYKVEPVEAVLARNLLAKDDRRAALLDEEMPCRPEVPLVSKPLSLACRAERLARETGGPDGSIVGPSGIAEGVGPDADSGAEMDLGEGSNVIWCHVPQVALVDFAVGDQSALDEFTQPRCGFRIKLRIIRRHVQAISSHAGRSVSPSTRVGISKPKAMLLSTPIKAGPLRAPWRTEMRGVCESLMILDAAPNEAR